MTESESEFIGDHFRIYPRGRKKTYCADFWHDGKHCRLSLKTRNRKIALDRALKLAHSLQEGSFARPSREMKPADASRSYQEFLKTEGRAKRTLTRYAGELREFLCFCERRRVKRLSAITPAIMDGYRAERRQNRELTTVNHETIVVNPLAGYRVGKAVAKKRPAATLLEVQRVLAQSPLWLRPILATLAFTGVRIGELQHLRVEDVDLVGLWVHVESREGAETKTRRSRKIPMHPTLQRLLAEHRRGRGPWFFTAGPSEQFPAGDHGIAPKKINDAFTRIAGRLGLVVGRKNNGYTIHSLRHFFETFAVNNRIPQRVVDLWMGHRSDRSMGAVYYTLTDAESQRFMNELPLVLQPELGDSGAQQQFNERI
jgi:integrase